MNNKESFDSYISKINEYYTKNEKVTINELKEATNRMQNAIEFPNKFRNSIMLNLDKVIIGIFIFLTVLLGLLNIQGFGLYFFGMAFFFSGLFVGMFIKYFGLIFLFSHGLTGFVFMINTMLGSTFSEMNDTSIISLLNSPVLQDKPTHLMTYLILLLAIIVMAFLSAIAHNIFEVLRDKRYFKTIPFILFFTALLMTYLINPIFHVIG